MGKQEDLLAAAVREQDLSAVLKLTGKVTKSKLIGSAKKLNFSHVDGNGQTLLHYAAVYENSDILKILIEHGAAVDAMDGQGVRSLHVAARQGNARSVGHLISSGSSVNDPAFDGSTPLHMACEFGHLETVELLLNHNGEPGAYNSEHKTAFDVACEFGHLKIVEKLVCSPQCGPLIRDYRQKTRDVKRTTCLHLAAKNGHVHVLRFLLEVGFDINRQTAHGICLHEAVMNGQIKATKFLLDWGIGLHCRNSFNQTALEIVHSSQKLHQNEKLIRLLTEAPFQPLTVRAVQPYHCSQQHNHLTFREGDFIRVVERHSDEIWKGYLFRDSDEVQQHVAYFPSSEVEIMRASDLTDDALHFPSSMTAHPLPPYAAGASVHQCLSPVNHHRLKPGPVSLSTTDRADRTAEWIVQSADVAATECGSGSPMSSKDNVSESNRSSTSSSSGSSGYLGSNSQVNRLSGILPQPNRLSGQSCESGVASLWPSTTCLPVVSTSSRLSHHSALDWLDESGQSGAPASSVNELFQQGLKDSDVMYVWLHHMKLTDCYQLFVTAGYDMPTVSRMTPEDLTAIGITQPSVRKHLTSEISRLNLNDKLPNVRSNNLLEWLQILNLEEYHATLMREGYTSIGQIMEITWEDLEDVGIHKLGHQKKLLLAIDRIKKLNSGKPSDPEPCGHPDPKQPSFETNPAPFGIHMVKPGNTPLPAASSETSTVRKDEVSRLPEPTNIAQAKNVIRLPPQTPFVHPSAATRVTTQHATSGAPSSEVIAIHVHRPVNSRTGSVKERNGDRTTSNDDGQHLMYRSFHGNPSRDFGGRHVDGDMTPTNDNGALSTDEADEGHDPPDDLLRPEVAPKTNRRASAGGVVSVATPGGSASVVSCLPSRCGQVFHAPAGFHDPHLEWSLRNLDAGVTYNSAPTTPSHAALGGSPAGNRSRKIVPQPPKRSNSIKDRSAAATAGGGGKTVDGAGTRDQSYADVSKSVANPHHPALTNAKAPDSGNLAKSSKYGSGRPSAELDNPLSRVIARLEWKDDQVIRPTKTKASDVYNSSSASSSAATQSQSSFAAQLGHSSGAADCNNTLPFANENIGTIRQRIPAKSSAPSGGGGGGGDLHNFHGSCSNSPGPKRSQCSSEATEADSRLHAKGTEAKKPPPVPSKKQVPGKNELPKSGVELKSNAPIDTGGSDVFDDIDSLFQGLTQELNQMLTLNG